MSPASFTPVRPHIPWHRRLEARVLFCVSLIAALTLAAVLAATERIVTTNSLDRATQDVHAATIAFHRLVSTRAEFAAAQTRLITGLPVFRAHMTDAQLIADSDTIHTMADDYRRQLKADFCVVTDASGAWVARPGWPAGANPSQALLAAIDAARVGQPRREMLPLDGRLYLIVTEPAQFAREVLGTLTAAYQLDDALATELARVTHYEVTLVSGGQISGSSLRSGERMELAALIAEDPDRFGRLGDPPALRELGSSRYVGGKYPLRAEGQAKEAGFLLFMRDWQPTQQFLDRIQGGLLWVVAIALLLTMGGSLIFSRRLTGPLREIAEVAGEIAAGRWDRRVPARGSAEATEMAAAFNDMTAGLSHWHAEAKSRAESLQAAYDRFLSVTESASDAIISTDAAGRIVFWNRRAEAMFGYPEKEAVGSPLTLIMPESGREVYRRGADQAPGAAQVPAAASTVELKGLRRDRSEFPLELSLAPWKAGGELFFTGIIRDITERKRAEEALREREEQLRQAQKMEAVGQLAGGVAHDFNNMLSVINGYSDLLLSEKLDEPTRESVGEILKAGTRAAGLTRQLLAFSRRQVLQPRILDLSEIVTGMDKMLRRLIGEDIELVTEIDAGLWNVKTDAGQIEQVLLNLAVNARDAMPEGGRLLIECRNVGSAGAGATPGSGRSVMLALTDTGCGMDAITVSRIFEPFFTTKEQGKGTGLGLSTVYGIVEQSGGTIKVESSPGRGARFRIYLPSVEADQATDARHERSWVARGTETVLLVEDEDMVRGLVRDVLRKQGYTVLEAAHGEEALTVSERHDGPIHMLLTDLVMPGMGGRVLSERLTRSRAGLKVLYMSGYTDDAVIGHGIREGGARFLQKPFSPDVLARTVREALAAALELVPPNPGLA